MAWLATPAGVVTEGGRVICEAPIHYLDSARDWDRNALLIAAAPELLGTLRFLADRFQPHLDERDRADIKALLTRATGFSP